MGRMSLEQAQELRNSTLWGYVVGEIEYRVLGALETLKTASTDEFLQVQNKIRTLESFKSLPDDVIAREE